MGIEPKVVPLDLEMFFYSLGVYIMGLVRHLLVRVVPLKIEA